MAKITSLACDKCGSHETATAIKEWSARRGSTHYLGELCDDCFAKLVQQFKPSARGGGRHVVAETKLEDIQKKA
jgi:hypothetical protein|tara:strand:- start:389 stop:610 length:222 start_codon:yes stop_codon:yes gene_type:complete